MRKLKWLILIIVVLIVVVIGGIILSIDSIIRATVETEGTAALNCTTTLASAHLSFLSHSLSLNDLEIGSPPGFSAPKMLTLGGSNVAVDPWALRKEPIHIASIDLDAPVLTIEQSGGKLNFNEIGNGAPSSGGGGGGAASGPPMKLIIDDLKMTNAKVIIRPGLVPGLGAEIPVPLPPLELKNVGNADGNGNGLALKDVVASVIGSMAGAAGNSDALPPELKSLLKLNVGQLAQQLGGDLGKQIGVLGNLGDLTKNVAGNLGKTVGGAGQDLGKNVGNAMQGLLGGKGKSNSSGN
jgi:uncharacterized protein involved in outer membrane biogenesis